jgi:hypothetical protein
MPPARRQPARTRLETWLWTGPVGHLLGGALDLIGALSRHTFRRVRGARALDRAAARSARARGDSELRR